MKHLKSLKSFSRICTVDANSARQICQKWDDTCSPITSPTVDSNEIQPMCLQTKPKIWWKSRLEIMR
jgi:hypothetical protein